MARYDYGLRGPRDTTEPRFVRNNARYDLSYRYDAPSDRRLSPRPSYYRVTAPYNMDYIEPRGERYPINYLPYGGEWPGQMGNEGMYRMPYLTRGGTRTHRGAPRPIRYDYPNFGPSYGVRYPDEL